MREATKWQTTPSSQVMSQVVGCLAYHGVSKALQSVLLSHAPHIVETTAPNVLSALLEETFSFDYIDFSPLASQNVMLVGSPGVGKTVMVAKLIAKALGEGKTPIVATLDCFKAGAVYQLEAYGHALGVHIHVCHDFQEFRHFLSLSENPENALIVDTPGIDPRNDADVRLLAQYVYLWDQPPVLCLPAGLDPLTAGERSVAFAKFGADRLVITQVDLVDRLGGVLVAAYMGRYALCALNQSPYIAKPFLTLRPWMLSKSLLMKAGIKFSNEEVYESFQSF